MSRPVLDRYKVLRPIGIGGMAHILLAERAGARGSFRRVVLKQILPALARDPAFTALFAHEAKVAMQLSHANIVQVFDFAESGGECVLEMEYVEGCDLRALLRAQGPLPFPVALHVALEVLKGLDYAHRRAGPDGAPLQIVHRDVSPGNILLSREGEVKVTDFGLSRSREKLEKSAGGVQGTFAFMSPEQAQGGPVTSRADLFATAAVLYAMLTGSSPFEGEGPAATLDRVRAGKFDPVSAKGRELPGELDGFFTRALAPGEGSRFESAAQMREALEALGQARGVRPDAGGLGRRVCALVPAESSAVESKASPSGAVGGGAEASDSSGVSATVPAALGGKTHRLARRTRRVPVGWLAGGAALVLSAGALAAVLTYRSGAGPAEAGTPGRVAGASSQASGANRSGATANPGESGAAAAVNRAEQAGAAGAPVRGSEAAVAGAIGPEGGTNPPAVAAGAAGPSRKGELASAGVAAGTRAASAGDPAHRPARRLPAPGAPARAAAAPGLLTITVDPWANVTIDGVARGTTPLRDLPLAPGAHELVLENPPLGAKTSKLVRVESGERLNVSETFGRSRP
ncbi:MAG: protein kinase domain-containing protein [Myxococcaceae bacterium]